MASDAATEYDNSQYIQLGRTKEGNVLATTSSAFSSLIREQLGNTLTDINTSNTQLPREINFASGIPMPNNLLNDLLIKSVGNENVDKPVISEVVQSGTGIPYYGTLVGDMLVNPSTIDPRTLRKMAETDDDINFALQYNIDSIVQSKGRYVHENQQIQNDVRHSLKTLKQGFNKLMRDVCTGFIYGFSVISLSWEYDEELGGNTIKDALPLPQSTMIFRVDPQGHIDKNGVGQFVYMAEFQNIANSLSEGWANFGPYAGWGGYNAYGCDQYSGDSWYDGYGAGSPFASTGDLQYPFRLPYYTNVGLTWLPRSSVLLFSNYGTASQMNPYGKSMLRHVYNLWLQKLAIQQIRTYALDKRSVPLMVFYCESRVASAPQNPNTGDVLETPKTVLETTRDEVQDLSSLGALFLPKDAVQVESLPIEGDIGMLESIEGNLRSAISKALGVPTGLTSSDESSYASATRQGVTNSITVAARREEIMETLIKDFVKPIIEQLYPKEIHKNDWGRFENELLTLDEKIKNTTLSTEQIKSGLASLDRLEDLNHMREKGGLEALKESEHKEYLENVKKWLEPTESMDKRDVEDLTSDAYNHDKERK